MLENQQAEYWEVAVQDQQVGGWVLVDTVLLCEMEIFVFYLGRWPKQWWTGTYLCPGLQPLDLPPKTASAESSWWTWECGKRWGWPWQNPAQERSGSSARCRWWSSRTLSWPFRTLSCRSWMKARRRQLRPRPRPVQIYSIGQGAKGTWIQVSLVKAATLVLRERKPVSTTLLLEPVFETVEYRPVVWQVGIKRFVQFHIDNYLSRFVFDNQMTECGEKKPATI